jgi:uncharacterized DUF497 family protein
MRITFDPATHERNIAERGLSFEIVAELEWETALAVKDTRRDCCERRLRVAARPGTRLHIAIITMHGDAMHVIRFRKANRMEVRRVGGQKG